MLAVRRWWERALLFVLLFSVVELKPQPFCTFGSTTSWEPTGRCTSLRHWMGFASHQQDVIVPWYFVRASLSSRLSTRPMMYCTVPKLLNSKLNHVNCVAGLRRSHGRLKSPTPVRRSYGELMISVLVFRPSDRYQCLLRSTQ